MFFIYLTTHSAHFIYGYMTSDHSDSERGNPLPPHGLLFPMSCKARVFNVQIQSKLM